MSREVPFLFSAPMVRALLDGRKTQTRRIITAKRPFNAADEGDVVWVKETYRLAAALDAVRPSIVNDARDPAQVRIHYEADGGKPPREADFGKLRPSIHMPRKASRIDLRVTAVRAERLHAITAEDAIAEGIVPAAVYGGKVGSWLPADDMRDRFFDDPRLAYFWLWSEINGAASTQANPEVWVYTFERVRP